MLEFHWNGQRSAVCGDGVHFFLPKRLNLFSLSFSLSFSRLPGLDSLVIVTLAGRVWARLEAGVLWVVGDTSILSEEIADVMAWIHVFISSFKKPQRQKAVTIRVAHALSNSLNIVAGEWIEVGNERKHGPNSSSGTPLVMHLQKTSTRSCIWKALLPWWCQQELLNLRVTHTYAQDWRPGN